MADSYWEYSVMNYLGNLIGQPTTDKAEAEARAKRNQDIANSVGERHYNYHVVKRRVTTGRWIKD